MFKVNNKDNRKTSLRENDLEISITEKMIVIAGKFVPLKKEIILWCMRFDVLRSC